MTVEEMLCYCEVGSADDWAFWVYLCDETATEPPPRADAAAAEDAPDRCARAVHLVHRACGLSWSPAGQEEVSCPPDWSSAISPAEPVYHWVELLLDGNVVDRRLAGWLESAEASLPVPLAEPHAGGTRPELWVSRHSYRLVRLANLVHPDCSDFDACFERSGIQLR